MAVALKSSKRNSLLLEMATLSDSTTSPSIPITDVQAHIALMRAIRKLQESIQQGSIPYNPQSGLALPSNGFVNFLEHAVQRFGAWINSQPSEGPLSTDEIPPLEVLMVWHTYMLSPGTYREDSFSRFPILATLGGMPWDKIVPYIDDKTGDFTPSQEQIAFWEKSTSLPFDSDTFDKGNNKALPFSVDLVKAILRQSLSLNRMLNVVDQYDSTGWISHAIDGYPKYMRLPPGGHVPPVEIDIVWHTHQLSGLRYGDESVEYFGHFIGHDDSQSPEIISKGKLLMDMELTWWRTASRRGPIDGSDALAWQPATSIRRIGDNVSQDVDNPASCNGPPSGCLRASCNPAALTPTGPPTNNLAQTPSPIAPELIPQDNYLTSLTNSSANQATTLYFTRNSAGKYPYFTLRLVRPTQALTAVLVPVKLPSEPTGDLVYLLQWRSSLDKLPNGSRSDALWQGPNSTLVANNIGPGSWREFPIKGTAESVVGWFTSTVTSDVGRPISLLRTRPTDINNISPSPQNLYLIPVSPDVGNDTM